MVKIQLLNAVTEDGVKQSARCWMEKAELFLSWDSMRGSSIKVGNFVDGTRQNCSTLVRFGKRPYALWC